MEHINYESNLNSITSVPEVAEALGTTVSTLDVWFPHVSKNMVIRWGQPEFFDYCKTLVQTTRPNRQGFPFEALSEINTIMDVHNILFPELKQELRIYF